MEQADFDVAVVGASITGCTAAILFGRRGLCVARPPLRVQQQRRDQVDPDERHLYRGVS